MLMLMTLAPLSAAYRMPRATIVVGAAGLDGAAEDVVPVAR